MTASRALFCYIKTPPTVYYARRTLPLARMQARLLTLLLEADFVTVADMLALGIKSVDSLRVQLSYLRRSLPPGVQLVNEYARGYRLAIQ